MHDSEKTRETQETQETQEKELVKEYISQLNPIQQKAFGIAQQHLGSSFHLVKSNGFIDWKKKQTIINNK